MLLVAVLAQQVDLGPTVEVADAISRLSGPGVIVVVLILMGTGRLIRRGEFLRMVEERNWWRDTASAALQIGEAASTREGR